MKQHPRRRSKRRTPAPTLHDLLRQPDADFTVCRIWRSAPGVLLPMAAAGCWILPHRRSRWMWAARLLHFMALRCE